MLARKQRVIRGASTPVERTEREQEKLRSLILQTQPAHTANKRQEQRMHQTNVMDGRIARLLDAIKRVREAADDDKYGLSHTQKQAMIAFLEDEVATCVKTILNGTRGSRYVTIDDLGPQPSDLTERQDYHQRNTLEPRLNDLVKKIRLVSEAGNDEFYGFDPAGKKEIVNLVREETNECFKAVKNSRRRSGYVIVDDVEY